MSEHLSVTNRYGNESLDAQLLLLLLGLLFFLLLHLRVLISDPLHLTIHLRHLPPVDIRLLLVILLPNISRRSGYTRLALVLNHLSYDKMGGTLFLVHELLCHVLVDILAVLLVLVDDNEFGYIIGLEEVDAVQSLEGGGDGGQIHHSGLVLLVIDRHLEGDALTDIFALSIELQIHHGHLHPIGVVEVLVQHIGYVLREADDELVLRLENA